MPACRDLPWEGQLLGGKRYLIFAPRWWKLGCRRREVTTDVLKGGAW